MTAPSYINRPVRHRATGMVGNVRDQHRGLLGLILEIQLGNGEQGTISLRSFGREFEWLMGVTLSPRRSAEIIPFPAKRSVARVIQIQSGSSDGGAS